MSNLIGSLETARIIGVNRQTIWRWTKEGILEPALVVGQDGEINRKQHLYDRDTVVKFADLYWNGEVEEYAAELETTTKE